MNMTIFAYIAGLNRLAGYVTAEQLSFKFLLSLLEVEWFKSIFMS